MRAKWTYWVTTMFLSAATVFGQDVGIPLFNGKNLDGWVAINGKPGTWTVRDGMIRCSGEPKGFLRTDKEYENYILEVEWRHSAPGGNSGIFFHTDAQPEPGAPYPRCIEAQLFDSDHGSLFGIRGASLVPISNPGKKGKTALAGPLENRTKPAGEWNKYVITTQDGFVKLEVNGKFVTSAKHLSQTKGYIGFQSEHSEVHFRNIRIRPLNGKGDWKTGVAKTKITPKGPMWMSGYAGRAKPATEKEHDLFAKALALEDKEGKRAVLITMDLVGIGRATSAAICDELKKKYGLKRDQIALNCSHTHSGPAVGRNLQGLFFFKESDWKMVDTYTDWLRKQIVHVVGNALEKMEPSKLLFVEGESDIAVNRRTNKHDEVAELRANGKLAGPSDYSVPTLVIEDSWNEIVAIVFGYACHPTKLSGKFDRWCGDYAGFAQIEIEKAHPGAIAMFVQGCGGDQTPWPRGDTDAKKAEMTGLKLATTIERNIRFRRIGKYTSVTNIPSEIKTDYSEIILPLSIVPERKKLESITKGKNKFKARLARNIIKRQTNGQSLQKSYDHYPVQTWRLGPRLDWIFLGGEVVVDYSLRFKEQFRETKVWVAGYSNDVMAYIPSERVLKEGGYEGGTSMVYYGLPAPWKTGIEKAIITEVKQQLNAITPKD